MVEFAMVFFPMTLMLLGIFELGRAMWTYHSVSAAVKRATRYTVVRGSACSAESMGCAPSVADVAQAIRQASLGLEAQRFKVTLKAGSQTVQCETLSSCLSNFSNWPAAPNNSVGRMVTISGEYTFDTFLFSFWPGVSGNGVKLRSASTEVIQF